MKLCDVQWRERYGKDKNSNVHRNRFLGILYGGFVFACLLFSRKCGVCLVLGICLLGGIADFLAVVPAIRKMANEILDLRF